MLKMVISCGGGMSSSALSIQMKKEIIEKGWEDRVSVEFIPFPLLINPKVDLAFPIYIDKQKEALDFDIALLCPHLKYFALNAIKKQKIKIPMYILPALLYGRMNLIDLIEDAEDLLELHKHTNDVLLHFPGEELLNIKRNISYRRWIQKHPIE